MLILTSASRAGGGTRVSARDTAMLRGAVSASAGLHGGVGIDSWKGERHSLTFRYCAPGLL